MDNTTSHTNTRRVPLDQRKRSEYSCDRCKSRKQKCHQTPGQPKCRHCQMHGYECMTTKPRKQRLSGSNVDYLRSRVSVLEGLVKELVPDVDLSNINSLGDDAAQALGAPLTPGPSIGRDEEAQQSSSTVQQETEARGLVHDLQGQGQYIGPASSYFFQMKLRTLLDRDPKGTRGRMYLFGRNPMNDGSHFISTCFLNGYDYRPPDGGQISQAENNNNNIHNHNNARSPSTNDPPSLDPSAVDALVRSYFEHVNVDFPVLHESTFLETFDRWQANTASVNDQPWLCTLHCVLILAFRVSPVTVSKVTEKDLWMRVQSSLTGVMVTSKLESVQAIVLAALHLHNTNHRDACWTLTGTAVRIAFAIGLHRDEVGPNGPRQARELRKLVWWTLRGFEQVQVSSHDRPNAIDDAVCSTEPPDERILGLGPSYGPPDYVHWWAKLMVLLGFGCRALSNNNNNAAAVAAGDRVAGPLDPAVDVRQKLSRWHDSLPQHLSMQAFDAQPPVFQRAVILLHIQYHYTVSLLTRSALLYHFSTLTKTPGQGDCYPDIRETADICAQSAHRASSLLLKLDQLGKFNCLTWWDMYYMYSADLVLALSIICELKKNGGDTSKTALLLLHDCSAMAKRHLANPMIAGTMHRWASVICELYTMAQEFSRTQATRQMPPEVNDGSAQKSGPVERVPVTIPDPNTNTNSNSNSPTDVTAAFGGGVDVTMSPDDPPQFPFLEDENGHAWQGAQWDDIGLMLLGEESIFRNL